MRVGVGVCQSNLTYKSRWLAGCGLPLTERFPPGCVQAGACPLLFVIEEFGSNLHPPIERHRTCGIHTVGCYSCQPGHISKPQCGVETASQKRK